MVMDVKNTLTASPALSINAIGMLGVIDRGDRRPQHE